MLRNLGILQRIYLVNLLSLITVVLVVSGTYFYGSSRIDTQLQSQGRQLVELLTDVAEYGVISGNITQLDYQLKKVLARNANISSIEIFDGSKKVIIRKENLSAQKGDFLVFSEPITIRNVPFNTYDLEEERLSDTTSAPQPISADTLGSEADAVGYVTVKLSRAAQVAASTYALLVVTGLAAGLMLVNSLVSHRAIRGFTRPLLETIDALRLMRKRKALVLPGERARGEIGELQATLAEMADSFFETQQTLEDRVMTRTTELGELNTQLVVLHANTSKLSAERRRLIQQVTNAAEDERKAISVEIHDQLNASLIVARLEAQHILDVLTEIGDEQHGGASISEVKEKLDSGKEAASKVLGLVGELYKMARGIVKRLRPEVIDTLGLVLALEEMVTYYDKTHPDCYFEFNARGELDELRSDLSLSVYRLVQESLSNIIKHAKATVVQVSLSADEERGRVILQVSDNGVGFDTLAVNAGIGLIGMRERVSGVDGELTLKSSPNGGASIVAELPYIRAVPPSVGA